ncbi:2-C-methyl-D-erythritol 4-phosphate cytidylyltransferase [Paenibacillus turpanensis]|uniref:2-C-methyl-D-erythritol 4-phosphate cytidylyltransferase n=1 Tax=Paenibacillus turpanensis TaxID=2689078 RepID=UPI00140D6D7A|nr:2-C-methyl-D-erythritol 4-phosphate cytidylyltransferase [Paenibacillus turpanensis]
MGKTVAVVVAAGRGSRMGTAESKQYLLLQGKPILVWTLQALAAIHRIDEIVLVTGADDVQRCEALVQQYGLAGQVSRIVPGGSERQHSVLEGLKVCRERDADWVLVHDGVRPFIDAGQMDALMAEAEKSGAAVLAVPVKDTIKVVGASGDITSTPDRRSLWAIHTPQAFRFSLLWKANEAAVRDGFLGTDDASLVERLGVSVRVAEGSYRNIKITTPEDLEWADWFIGRGENV